MCLFIIKLLLLWRYVIVHVTPKSVCNDFSYGFINNITKRYRFEVTHIFRVFNLWNKGYKGNINFLNKVRILEAILNVIANKITNKIPIIMKKEGVKTIVTHNFNAPKLKVTFLISSSE